MPTLLDYLTWRGDLSFAERAFNDVDNLVFCALSYLDLRGLVPADGHSVTVAQAAARQAATDRDVSDPGRLTVVPPSLLQDLAASTRFAGVKLSWFVDEFDPHQGMQFSAVTAQLPDGSRFVAFRGTDNTLLGWRENFTMAFETMPSQLAAANYLADRLAQAPSAVRVGGHSKGGNLALFAALAQTPSEQDRLTAIYSNDGPGLAPQVLDEQALARLADRVVKIIPADSVVGMLFDEDPSHLVVTSSAEGLLQHDLMTWQVQGTGFVPAPGLTPLAQVVDQALRRFLRGMDGQERRQLTDALFSSLAQDEHILITQVASGPGSMQRLLGVVTQLDHQARRPTRLALGIAWRTLLQLDLVELLRQRTTSGAGLQLGLGLIFLVIPAAAVQILGTFALVVLMIVVTVQTGRLLLNQRRLRRGWAAATALAVGGVVTLAAHLQPWLPEENLTLSLCLATLGVGYLHHGWSRRRLGRGMLLATGGLLSLTLSGAVIWARPLVSSWTMDATGNLLLVGGAFTLLVLVRDQTRRPGLAARMRPPRD